MPTTAKLYLGATEIGGGVANADFSNTPTGTYTDSGIDYKYVRFTSSGSLIVTTEGFLDFLVVGGGGSGGTRGGGQGGCATFGKAYAAANTYTVTVGGATGASTLALSTPIVSPAGQNGYSDFWPGRSSVPNSYADVFGSGGGAGGGGAG